MTARAVFVAAIAVTVVARAAPLKLPGFPLKLEGVAKTAPALADVDQDGSPDLVTEHGNRLSIHGSDGKVKPGFPVELATLAGKPGASMVGTFAVGDLDGDGRLEIAMCLTFGEASDGALVVVKADGTPFLAAPIAIPKGAGAGPTIADVDGNGKNDLAFGTKDAQLVVLDAAGAPLPGFPVRLTSAATSPVSFGSLVRGQKPALAVGTADGRVYAVLPSGQVAKGFPLETRFAVSGAPAFGDLDNDGEHELVVASQDYSVYAVHADGRAVGGFPVKTNYRIYGGPALGDLDRDGALDIVVASGDGKVYAWTARAKPLAGFPVSAGARVYGNVVVGDGDRDGRDEVFVVGDGSLYGFNATGKPIDGFPVRLNADQLASPVLGDAVPDSSVELFVPGAGGEVQGFRLQRKGELPQSALSWPATSHDASRQSHYGPNVARYRNLAIGPATPRVGEPLTLTYEFFDLDGDPEPATRLRWTLNDQPVPELDGLRVVPVDRLKKGQKWKALAQAPEDFALFKEGPGSALAVSPVITIGNTAPGAAQVAIEPAEPRVTDALSVRIATPAPDVDGDAITYRYRWFRDGDPAGDKAVVPAGQAKKSERWRVSVTPFDGEAEGPASESEVIVRNSAPGVVELALTPAGATTLVEVSAKIAKAAVDPDGDPVSYRYAWAINGDRRALAPDRATFPKLVARRGDTLALEAWATDGELEGPRSKAEAKIANAPPTATKAAIAPATPNTDDVLTAGAAAGASDPDGDALTYKVRWFRDGAPFATTTGTVPASETKKGQKWAAEVVAFDNELEGPPARAEVTIVNLPPGRPKLALSNATPGPTEAAAITIAQPAIDPDGDVVKYEYAWSVDGKPAFAKDKVELKAGEGKKGQRIVVEVVAIDSDNARGPGSTVEIRPRNTAPSAPVVALEPKEPTLESALKAVVSAPSADPDGDPVTYRYRWTRNGLSFPDATDKAELKAGTAKRGDEWSVVVIPFDGMVEGTAAEARTVIGNLAPPAPQVALKPATATALTGLSCEAAAVKDPDGDPVKLEYRWFLGDAPFALALDTAKLPDGVARGGQKWRCDVVATDGTGSSPVATASATIANTAPSGPVAAVEPAKPRSGDPLTCAIVSESTDVDGERVSYEYAWTPPAGVKLPALEDPSRLPGGLVKKGQKWRCEAAGKDAASKTAGKPAEVAIVNTPPRAPRLKIAPADARAGAELRCELTDPAADADGDAIGYSFSWTRNGEKQPFAESSSAVPGRLVKAGDKWRCAAVASDPEGKGGEARSAEIAIAPAAAAAR